MTGDLQNELAVPPFIEEFIGGKGRTGSPHRTNGRELTQRL
jgi:hypothetical protein